MRKRAVTTWSSFSDRLSRKIKVASVQVEHEAGFPVGIVFVMNVTTLFQYSQSCIYFCWVILIDIAEFLYVEFESFSTTAPHTYLEEIGEVFVDIPDQFFLWKGIVDAFGQFAFIAGIIE